MRKLGIDYGDSRVGIAISDELGITAQGLCTISHNGNDKIVLKKIRRNIRQLSSRHNYNRNSYKYGWYRRF